MGHGDKTDFSKKHGADTQLNPAIKAEIVKQAKDEKLPCAVAFDIAGRLGKSPKDVGIAIDLMNFRITKCQLGLFGYASGKKIDASPDPVDDRLKSEIEKGLDNGRLPCNTAWSIAEQLNIGKMAVSNACEALGIKIKPCQLGAF